MERPSNSTVIGLAAALASVAIAGLAAYAVLVVLSDYQRSLLAASTDGPLDIPVMVALREIPVGRTIVAEDLVEMQYRDAYIPPSALLRTEDTVGRVARERILPGELVREERLAPPGTGNDLDAVIAAGMRAESINISGAQQVSGFLNAGNRVDVITTLFDDQTGKPSETRTLLQAVRVLAVDDRAHESLERGVKLKPQVTLEIPPGDAEKLTHALSHGRVRLVLRSDIDFAWVDATPAVTADLLGGTQDAERMTMTEFREAVGSSPSTVVRILHGSEETVEKVR